MPLDIPLPTNGLPYFDLQTVLDGTTYTLEFRWNVRAQAWWMRVLDSQATTVQIGDHRLVVGIAFPMYVTERQPPGLFYCWDTSKQQIDPTLTDLGVRVHLIYFTAADLA